MLTDTTDTTLSYPSVLLDCVAALLGERLATERMNIDKALTSLMCRSRSNSSYWEPVTLLSLLQVPVRSPLAQVATLVQAVSIETHKSV